LLLTVRDADSNTEQLMKLNQALNQRKGADVFMPIQSSAVINGRLTVRHAGVDRSLRYINQHFSRPIGIRELLKVSGLSRRGYMKAFKRGTNINPGRYLRMVRIEHASRLLIEQDLPLKLIASQCGFRSENTFCVAFSREMKISPKRYQRQYWLTTCRDHLQVMNQLMASNRRFSELMPAHVTNSLRNSTGIHQYASRSA
jgi:AraC-like DNA-binding protein